MRTLVRVAIVAASAALGAPLATARADTTPATPSSQQQTSPTPAAQPKSESGDIVQMVEEALATVDLRQDQKDQLQKLGADADAKVAKVDEAKRAFMSALADQIESGKVDASALRPLIDKDVEAADAASPDLRSNIEKIHEILDPAQRKQFADAFRDVLKKHAADRDPKALVDHWAKTLNLTDDQKEKISAIIGHDTVASDVAKARIELVLAAFPGDRFEMDDLLPEGAVGGRVERMMNRIVDVAAQVTAILTPDQRKIAAAAMRNDASQKQGGGGGGSKGVTSKMAPSGQQAVDHTSEAIWAGGGVGVAGGYARSSGYGFSTGYAGGYGGTYLF